MRSVRIGWTCPRSTTRRGDLTNWQGNTYEYDALNMMRRYRTAAGLEWAYIYNIDGERGCQMGVLVACLDHRRSFSRIW